MRLYSNASYCKHEKNNNILWVGSAFDYVGRCSKPCPTDVERLFRREIDLERTSRTGYIIVARTFSHSL